MKRVALIGDYSPDVVAHRMIPQALALSARNLGLDIEPVWIHTSTLTADAIVSLNSFDAIWCVPASPYANTEGVLAAIRHARESKTPFLGTCGGFQHAIIEYARNVLGLHDADHAETAPDAEVPIIAPLACSLVEKSGTVHYLPGSRLRDIMGQEQTVEEYHCRFGINPAFDRLFSDPAGLIVVARDEAGEARAVEGNGHPFYFATLFQPERSAKNFSAHPLITTFIGSIIGT